MTGTVYLDSLEELAAFLVELERAKVRTAYTVERQAGTHVWTLNFHLVAP